MDSHMFPPTAFQSTIFPLQSDQWLLIQKFAYKGAVLPDNRDDYRDELGLEQADIDKFVNNINGILSVYSGIRIHSRHFRSHTYPQVVEIARGIGDYAQYAPKFYEDILEKLNQSSDPHEKMGFNTCVNRQMERTAEMHQTTENVVQTLEQFNKNISEDRNRLKSEEELLDGTVNRYGAKLAEHDATKKILARGQDSRRVNARLIKIFDKVNPKGKQAHRDIAMNNSELEACNKMKFKCETMASHLSEMLHLVEGATTALGNILGAFEEMTKDLKLIKEKAAEIRKAQPITRTRIQRVQEKWKELELKTDLYVQAAYVPDRDELFPEALQPNVLVE